MDDATLIFGSPLAVSVFFYAAVAAVSGLGILVSWVEAAPSRRRRRWLRHAIRPIARELR